MEIKKFYNRKCEVGISRVTAYKYLVNFYFFKSISFEFITPIIKTYFDLESWGNVEYSQESIWFYFSSPQDAETFVANVQLFLRLEEVIIS